MIQHICSIVPQCFGNPMLLYTRPQHPVKKNIISSVFQVFSNSYQTQTNNIFHLVNMGLTKEYLEEYKDILISDHTFQCII